MTGRRTFLIVQSVLCALVAGLFAAAALTLYFDGAAKQVAGALFDAIYTREKVGAKLLPILPLFFAGIGMTVSGLILGIRDERPNVLDEKLLRDLAGIRDRAVRQNAAPKETCARYAVLALAAVLIIAGILNGGLQDVLAKGITICSECIGLG
ncbi:MAG: hypothetical protein IJ174_03435 [Clostridia bacterium]|nr:hypothetical protein [Clostridia bacterium]